MRELTYKQKAFCREYVANKGNATQAYLAVYGTEDYNTAGVESCRLLQDDAIQAEIVRLNKPKRDAQKSERERIKEWCWSVIESPAEKTENKARCADILNRMNAEYIQRTENTTENTVKLDKEALDTLLNAQI